MSMISIIVPAHNEEEIIAGMLARLREAAHGLEHEIILSDDRSTDATIQRARPLATKISEYAGGPMTIGAARNRGARAAAGDLLIFLDSDVRLRDPELFFKRVLEHFQRNPKLVAMTVSMRVAPESETWADALVLSFFDFYFRLCNALGIGLTHGKCMIIRASAFVEAGGFDERIIASEDAELFMRLAKKGKTMLDPQLRIYFSGRRAHAIGWPRLLWRWLLNGLWVVLFGRSYSQSWSRVAKGSP